MSGTHCIAGGKKLPEREALEMCWQATIRALLVWIWGVIFSSLTIRGDDESRTGGGSP